MNQKQDAKKYAQKGRSANRRKDFNKAVVDYSRAIKLNKNKSHHHFGMARTLTEQKKYKEACIHWKRVVMMDPEDAVAYYNLGCVLDMLGKIDESIKMYRESIRLDPDDAEAHENLAIVLSTKGSYEEAHEHYMKVLELKPEDAYAVANGLGCLYFLQGMFAKASEEFQKSISLNEKLTDAYWNMSLVLFCENKNEEAEKFFEEGMRIVKEEENKINTLKESIASYTSNKTRFEAKLKDNHHGEIENEEQTELFRIMIDGLTEIINLSTQYLEK